MRPHPRTVKRVLTAFEKEPGEALMRKHSLEHVTLDEVVEKVKERAGFGSAYGDHARAVVDAYAKAFPGRTPVEIWSLVSSTRQAAVALADAKAQQAPPVFMAW